MKPINFYGSNREIVKENVVKCYSMIEKYGFQPSMGKIKLVQGKDLESEKLYRIEVIPKFEGKEISIRNFKVEYTEVTDEEERRNVQSPVDGQHRLIAMYILEKENKLTFDEDSMTEIVSIPENMTVAQFTASINNGRPWNYGDFTDSGLNTGNEQIDYIENVISKDNLKSEVVRSLYTLGQPELKANVVRDLKMGIDRLPKQLKLSAETQELGDRVLQAFKDSFISEDSYNNGRLAKGLKLFYKSTKDISIDDIVGMISIIDKNVWYGGKRPGGSPEAKDYAENFQKWYVEYKSSNK